MRSLSLMSSGLSEWKDELSLYMEGVDALLKDEARSKFFIEKDSRSEPRPVLMKDSRKLPLTALIVTE